MSNNVADTDSNERGRKIKGMDVTPMSQRATYGLYNSPA
eukprot:CAMPEP_0117468154 /NCGR_PEP_ID=MMETSP0784-20121206/6028_1 /TAXON_ID=39447 /ORGANISM="" /LENGTH=38 /DNA_ID= /DNA_START= /DNA_END= /DNA_ORIENTATION=